MKNKKQRNRQFAVHPILAAVVLGLTSQLFVANEVKAGENYGSSYTSYSAEAERMRRDQMVIDARNAYYRGAEFEKAGQWEQAGSEYRTALDLLPVAERTADEREVYADAFARVCVQLAKIEAEAGNLDQAKRYLTTALEFAPDHEEANLWLERMNDPEWFAPGDDQRHRENINEVVRLLKQADANYQSGLFIEAQRLYQDVLRIDPYNTAARNGMARVDDERSHVAEAAHDRTRAEMIQDVASKWEMPIPDRNLPVGQVGDTSLTPFEGDTRQELQAMLSSFFIEEIIFRNAVATEAISFLQTRSQELDPTGVGIDFVIDRPAIEASGSGALTRPITIEMRNAPMDEVLRYICEMADLRYTVDQYSVWIIPGSSESEEMQTKSYQVPASFETLGLADSAEPAADADPFAPTGGDSASSSASAIEIMRSRGILFDEGATASYQRGTSTLRVTNTRSQMELVDMFVDSIQDAVIKQVEITSKFIEIRQDNTEELGFDWLMGGFGFGGGDRILGGGGTAGNSSGIFDVTQFPFLSELVTPALDADGLPILDENGEPVFNREVFSTGRNPITGGLRTGSQAIRGGAIDALLRGEGRSEGTIRTPAPGILSIAGILTDPEFQVVLRGLSQGKSTDLLTAPMVVTKSAEPATIEVIRELIYPTEYDPPEIPQEVGAAGNTGFPVTPAHPAAFDTRNTGVTLTVNPQIGPDGKSINLALTPEVVEFEGFVNYGSPIAVGSVDALGRPVQLIITENRVDMPVFSTRRAETTMTIYDGQTVAIGGMIREDVQRTNDKVPLIGDLPYVGRLFRSQSQQHLRRNLMIFVSVRLVDPSGQAYRELRGAESTSELLTE